VFSFRHDCNRELRPTRHKSHTNGSRQKGIDRPPKYLVATYLRPDATPLARDPLRICCVFRWKRQTKGRP
jgi:hypothetical protein